MTEQVEVSEIDLLKERADDIGVKYSPNIGVDKLREKVNAVLGTPVVADTQKSHMDIIKEATKLVRVRITNLNPNKKEYHGEFFSVGNKIVKTISKFVPFEEETHVPQMMLSLMQDRKYAQVHYIKNHEGHKVPTRKARNEFQIEILAPLTVEELKELEVMQSKRQSV